MLWGVKTLGSESQDALKYFLYTTVSYVNWSDTLDDGCRGSRFVKPIWPYTKPLATTERLTLVNKTNV